MNALPEQMLQQMLDALAGIVKPDEAPLLVGQLLAWHSLAGRGVLPDDLVPSATDASLTPTMLSEVFGQLEGLETLGVLAVAFQGRRDSAYTRISPDALTALARASHALVMLDSNERRQLADAWVDEILTSDPSRQSPSIPLEVADLVVRSLGLLEGQAVHCPGAAMDSVAVAAMKRGLEPFVESMTAPTTAAIYAAITESKMRYLCSDPFRPHPDSIEFLKGVEACAAVPPWNIRFDALARLEHRPSRFGARTSEALGLELVALGPARESAVVVPNGLLGGRGPEAELRHYLVENGPLKAVIGFPPNLLAGAGIAFSILRLSRAASTEPVVFCKVDEKRHLTAQGKVRSRDRRFIGADEVLRLLEKPDGELASKASRDAIAARDFALTPYRYLWEADPVQGEEWMPSAPLGDLYTIVKPQFLPSDESDARIPIQEAIPGELPPYGYLTRVERTRYVHPKDLQARGQQTLQKNDVLLSTKGTIGKVGIADPAGNGPPLLPSQASVILRRKPGAPEMDPRCLVMYLRSSWVQNALASLAVGGTIPNIALADLKDLPVWVLSRQEQQPLIDAFETQARLEAEIQERREEQKMIGYDALAFKFGAE